MLKEQFERAFRLAISDDDLSRFDDSPLFGCGLPGFDPVQVPIEAVAKFLRWQCVFISGEPGQPQYDGEELEYCRRPLVWPSRRVEVIDQETHCPHCGEIVAAT